MSKYGKLSRDNGHSKWFLQRTLKEHDRSMDDPWMQLVYKKVFSVKQYTTWLVMQHASFEALERLVEPLKNELPLSQVYDADLLRTGPLEVDIQQLHGDDWREAAAEMIRSSEATQRYLDHLAADAADPMLLLAHHFLQYNAVLAGGQYLGDCVSEKLGVARGCPGVKFYDFVGVSGSKHAARVQQYLRELDSLEISDAARESMVKAMVVIYEDIEAMMAEVYQVNPALGIDYNASKSAELEGPEPIPPEQQVELTLSELQEYTGADGGRILLSVSGTLLDISAGREIYSPGGGYSLFAGRDVTKCLGSMSLEVNDLDDLHWVPTNEGEENTLQSWKENLMRKYPVAGRLKADGTNVSKDGGSRAQVSETASTSASSSASTGGANPESAKCPISGKDAKDGACPMASLFGVTPPKTTSTEVAKENRKLMGGTGKSLTAGYTSSSQTVSTTNGWFSEDGVLYLLCPLHWDLKVMKLLAIFSATSFCGGLLCGWRLAALRAGVGAQAKCVVA